jgi:flagellar hook-basal body complex protein FliE
MANLSIENLSPIVQPGVSTRESVGIETKVGGGNNQLGQSFSEILRNSVQNVNELQTQADTAIKELVAGRSKNIHETMLTIERADSALKLAMSVRNKILDAYKEVMRMQV